MSTRHTNLRLFFVLLSMLILCACKKTQDAEIDRQLNDLQQKAKAIDTDFRKIRLETDRLAQQITSLYVSNATRQGTVDMKKYQLAENGVLFKSVDDGGSAVFVSGYYPVDDKVKHIVWFTEALDSSFKKLVTNYPEIVQVYYNDSHSINRIYPYFDVLSQYEAHMNIPGYNFYYQADKVHNPKRKSLWVSEPYVDPAGRGWIVSAIAPVYYQNELVGVPGIDVTIHAIMKRYIQDEDSSMVLIMDNRGTIVAAQEATVSLLSFPPLRDHKYIETIKQDTYRKQKFSLCLSKDRRVRELAEKILKRQENVIEIELQSDMHTVLAARIPEMNWYLLEIAK